MPATLPKATDKMMLRPQGVCGLKREDRQEKEAVASSAQCGLGLPVSLREAEAPGMKPVRREQCICSEISLGSSFLPVQRPKGGGQAVVVCLDLFAKDSCNKAQEIYCLTGLGTGSLKLRGRQGWFLLEPPRGVHSVPLPAPVAAGRPCHSLALAHSCITAVSASLFMWPSPGACF